MTTAVSRLPLALSRRHRRTAQTPPVRQLTADTLAKIDAHHAAETAKHRAELDQQAEMRRQAEEAKAMQAEGIL